MGKIATDSMHAEQVLHAWPSNNADVLLVEMRCRRVLPHAIRACIAVCAGCSGGRGTFERELSLH